MQVLTDSITRNAVLVQNQGEMLKSGRLATPYKGIADCAARTYADEGLVACACSCSYSLSVAVEEMLSIGGD